MPRPILEMSTVDAAWTAVGSFSNAWVNFGAPYFNAGYRKIGDRVYLRGAIKTGTLNQAAFTLPAGYRPTATVNFAVNSNGAFGVATVSSAGAVTPVAGNATSFYLDGISFDTLA